MPYSQTRTAAHDTIGNLEPGAQTWHLRSMVLPMGMAQHTKAQALTVGGTQGMTHSLVMGALGMGQVLRPQGYADILTRRHTKSSLH